MKLFQMEFHAKFPRNITKFQLRHDFHVKFYPNQFVKRFKRNFHYITQRNFHYITPLVFLKIFAFRRFHAEPSKIQFFT